jgi:hypothetical protein
MLVFTVKENYLYEIYWHFMLVEFQIPHAQLITVY